MHQKAPARCVTFHLTDGFECHLGNIPVKVMTTPGHTKDSIALVFDDRILTGDVLFLDDAGAGRTDLPGGDPGEHWDSMQRVLGLPDHLIVYPAHEYRAPPGVECERSKTPQSQFETPHQAGVHRLSARVETWAGGLDERRAQSQLRMCARSKAAWIPVDVPACEVKGTMALGANDQQVAGIPAEEVKRELEAGTRLFVLDVREKKEEAMGPNRDHRRVNRWRSVPYSCRAIFTRIEDGGITDT